MKLNRDCMRDVLLTVEEEVGFKDRVSIQTLHTFSRLKEYKLVDIFYCVEKLTEAGFIKGITYKGGADVSELTFEGHEFIESIRDDDVWNKTKNELGKVGGATLPIIVELATSFLKTKLGLPV
ncbi:DUF2513 domain-containing protein [Bacillus velezensis]|uniref:DUF2513 domain-containing protein n=1 Tax=Bacillus velezensis TaxID=492670 RepID=UPI00272FF717|nr:DUF2513 domain-containing protein [Bacillus velezensis]MDP1503126.1 DUF2513 domain-containing protein [Bacillus velezensis]MDP1506985.1 DUF2513 domain-containing protein [Bacillus velezensis]